LELASSGFSLKSLTKLSTALTLTPFNIFSSGIATPPFVTKVVFRMNDIFVAIKSFIRKLGKSDGKGNDIY
jgi:hypothetical protein